MGAEHIINPKQLTMFERAGDLADPEKFKHMDSEGLREDISSLSSRKVDGAKEGQARGVRMPAKRSQSLYDSIKEKGVQKPVQVRAATYKWPEGDVTDSVALVDGHHRVFAQNDINPNAFIPVKWD